MAAAMLADACALLQQYGYRASERSGPDTPLARETRVWTFSRATGRVPASDAETLFMEVGVQGELLAWKYHPGDGDPDDDRDYCRKPSVDAVAAPVGVIFDHVTREVLGAEFRRGDGQPFRDLDNGAGAARRFSPLETLISFIVQYAPR